ncbi:MAG: SMP-30/gluconolactonase/LRE family protein, partial [Tannerellaceae bacterium]|nr:SMP-30/gluconolactonase/LRE family protein [Tannerellaceae bacterium]
WNAETQSLSILADYPWKPFTLSTDTEDNLIVIFRYDPQPGFLVDGRQETVARLPDDNPMYSGWGNSGWAARAYSINPNDPDESFRPLPRAATAALIPAASKIIYPASRWRGNFARTVVAMPDTSFVAPDGKTIIPETYDLGRSAALTSVMAGQQEPVFIVHENKKSTVRLEVKPDGSLTNLADAYPHGQYSNVTDRRGNLYIADGEIFVYNKEGKAVNRLRLEERPLSLAIGGREHNILFVTTSRSLYSVRIF